MENTKHVHKTDTIYFFAFQFGQSFQKFVMKRISYLLKYLTPRTERDAYIFIRTNSFKMDPVI